MTRPLVLAAFVLAAVAAILAGLSVIDGPDLAREKRLDERRTGDLIRIDHAIARHYQRHGVLPQSLEDTDLGIVPRDPETDAPYRYEIAGEGYRLCATFRHPGAAQERPAAFLGRDFDEHDAGPHCFDRPLPKDARP